MVQETIDWFYDEFVTKVAEGRGLSLERTRELAQGRVYTGTQAVENGLADELGGLHDAIDHACRELGVEREDAAVAFYRRRGSFVNWVMSEVAMRLSLHRFFDIEAHGLSDVVEFRMTGDVFE